MYAVPWSERMRAAVAACREAERCLGNLDDAERAGLAPLVVVDLLRLVAPHLVAVPIAELDRLAAAAKEG